MHFKPYYELTKPGIIYGNMMTTVAGFFLASRGHISIQKLAAAVAGLSFIIGCGCIINNYFDRHMDAKMPRTKNRGFVTGAVSVSKSFILAAGLGMLGFSLLYVYTNLLTVFIALFGTIIYVGIYTPLKSWTSLAPLIGSLSGAVPILVGYSAVSNKCDTAAILLFIILCIWQIPHFYAIAIRRAEDYQQANIPVLPVTQGTRRTKIHIMFYIPAFIIATVLLTLYGYAGYFYFVILLLLGAWWFISGLQGFALVDDKVWAKKMFFISLAVLTVFCITISASSAFHLP